jgi:hypothetical protein
VELLYAHVGTAAHVVLETKNGKLLLRKSYAKPTLSDFLCNIASFLLMKGRDMGNNQRLPQIKYMLPIMDSRYLKYNICSLYCMEHTRCGYGVVLSSIKIMERFLVLVAILLHYTLHTHFLLFSISL